MLGASQELITRAQVEKAFTEAMEEMENRLISHLKTVEYNSPEGVNQIRALIHTCFMDIGMAQLAEAIDSVLSMAIETKIDYVKENRCSFDDVLRFQ